ncbi:MAG: hypothetical protein ACI83H_002890 [Glaciecola sp.]|jgi:hypothetical protein
MNKNYILTLLMTLCLTVASFGQEMMLNGGLENWTSNTDPTDWTTAQNITQESEEKHAGSFSAKQTKDASGGYKKLIQNIPNTTVGESYTVSFWYKVAPDAGSVVKMWSNFRDSSGGFIDGTTDDITLGVSDNAWTKFEATVTAPATSVKFWFELRTYNNTTVYFDDFSFFHNTTASLKNNAIVGFAAYPNPVSKGILNISSASDSFKNITIFNLLGKQVLSSSFSGIQSNVDVSSISAGIYILKATEAGKTVTKKLVIR